MNWTPITRQELDARIDRELLECSAELRRVFEQTRTTPAKWALPPWGDRGGGFWVIAVWNDRALWFNDIEDGFNISPFASSGEIPAEHYSCNQDALGHALSRLVSTADFGPASGPPTPIP